MLTPISTANTAGGPAVAVSGSRTSTAGRLLITLASTAATAAIASKPVRLVLCGTHSRSAESRPLSITARTTTASASTNARKGRSAAATIPATVPRPRGRDSRVRDNARSASTSAPAAAAQAGLTPAAEVMTNPASVAATVAIANHGGAAGSAAGAVVAADRSAAK